MKKTILLIIILLGTVIALPQSKKELKANITALTAKIELLNSDIIKLTNQNLILADDIEELKSKMAVLERQMPNTLNQSIPNNQPNISNNLHNNSPPSQVGRCKAITASGSQCNRNADAGSEYCWQHKKKYDNPENVKSGNQAPVNNNSNYNGHEIQTGPRGGKYYINSNGKKTYIRK